MKIYFLGTCAGTEPMPTRKHMSFAVEIGERIYWFDAGEGCSYTAHNLGMDLLAVKSIFISHTHMDHVGGLGNLLWNIRKLRYTYGKKPYYGDVELYIPNMDTWDGLYKLLKHTETGFVSDYNVNAHLVKAGIVYDDGFIKVTAISNSHLGENNTDAAYSYSYKIECEEKTVIYSGDIGAYNDMDELFDKPCDALIVETGHFGIDAVYEYTKNKDIGKIFFSHNGREILNNPEQSQQKMRNLFADKGIICEDGMIQEL